MAIRCTQATRLFTTKKPLTLDQIASKLKFEVREGVNGHPFFSFPKPAPHAHNTQVTDLDEGVYGLESKDVAYAIEIAKVNVPLSGGLGLGLEELKRGRDGRGCVLVSALAPGGNAEKSGKIKVGDMVCYLGKEPKGMVRTEGLDFEQTMGAMQEYVGTKASSITLVLKRLVFRESIDVTFSYAPAPEEVAAGAEPWTKSVSMLTGSNLRKEMLRQSFPVYDKKTLRFDQPYVSGDCGGEGICGTCLCQVLEGKELLNKPDGVEDMVLKKWGAANWRLSCRTVVGAVNTPGNVRIKLTPQKPFNKKK